MPEVLLLGEEEVRRHLDVDAMLLALERAFVALSSGAASVPPRVAATTPAGLVAAMPGYVPGWGAEVKLVSVYPGNVEQGRPSHQAVIVLFDERTGTPVALMDGTHITAMRTAGASAVSVRELARRDARVLAILGAGVQGRSHLAVVPRARDFHEVRIASRRIETAARLAAESVDAVVAESFEAAVRGADVVCCCTDAAAPVLQRAWLDEGTHVTSVGGTFGPEVDAGTVGAARVFVESRAVVGSAPPAGAHELLAVDPVDVTELGEVLSKARPGRRDDTELTLYKSIGNAVEDAASAALVYEAAMRAGDGRRVQL